MATKNLAKTSIEGGRTGSYKFEVEDYRARERAASRSYLKAVTVDPELAEHIDIPKRIPVEPEFDDKLRPVYRYLDANVGRPWSKVRSELFEKFDIRTTPGRHILFDHILREVQETPHPSYGWWDRWMVDNHGILRAQPRKRRANLTRMPAKRAIEIDYKKICSWLGNRAVRRQGDKFVWMYSDKKNVVAIWGEREYAGAGIEACRFRDFKYVQVDRNGEVILMPATIPATWGWHGKPRYRFSNEATHYEVTLTCHGWRRGRLLDKDDEAYFRSLSPYVQMVILGEKTY